MLRQAYAIGVIDCNNFFVSCERLFRPDLRKRPVVVLSSNDGCVVARSQEVKDKGIPMGVPLFQVKDSLKDMGAVVFSSNFTLYRDLSRRIFGLIKNDFAAFEQYSVDEAFFTVPIDQAEALARVVKDKVERCVGVPVSVGVAASKTLAKRANVSAKRDGGLCVMGQEAWVERSTEVRLGELWGVGAARVRAFSAAGLHTAADLMAAPADWVGRVFGVEGVRLLAELRGEPAYAVGAAHAAPKSIMSSRSFARSTFEKAVVKDAVAHHVRHVVGQLRRAGLEARRMTVQLRSSRYEAVYPGRGSEECVLSAPSADVFTLMAVAMAATERLFTASVAYKKVGVLLSELSELSAGTSPLFGGDKETATAALLPVIGELNDRWGHEVLKLGTHVRGAAWQAGRAALSPSYTTAWRDVKVARTA